MAEDSSGPRLSVGMEESDTLLVSLSGHWNSQPNMPGLDSIEKALEGNFKSLKFDTSGLGEWNTGLLAFLLKCLGLCRTKQIQFDEASLPEGARKLLQLAEAVPEKKDAKRESSQDALLSVVGQRGLALIEGGRAILEFIGENILAMIKLFRGKAQFRWSDTWLVMQEAGPEALPIVLLINFLIGLILAFVASVQLTQFGAAIYVADTVAIGTVREMGCIMTGIIICGRTGAAFAAQLGTMKVNEEIDAFIAFGISPVEFLVLPRMIALILMMPLLCVFADLVAITGGFLVSISILDVTSTEYIDRTIQAITLGSFLLGIGKGCFFGVLVALTGCLRGMQCGDNAAAVGQATTSAVVAGITAIIAADGLFAIITSILDI